mmetsp:Transcript_9383/g.14485  ORF Transcript_9383/g.14485 Transcript_9383/m.14485 type:complete len:232 (-) Transcript_9383:2586-3281(-)
MIRNLDLYQQCMIIRWLCNAPCHLLISECNSRHLLTTVHESLWEIALHNLTSCRRCSTKTGHLLSCRCKCNRKISITIVWINRVLGTFQQWIIHGQVATLAQVFHQWQRIECLLHQVPICPIYIHTLNGRTKSHLLQYDLMKRFPIFSTTQLNNLTYVYLHHLERSYHWKRRLTLREIRRIHETGEIKRNNLIHPRTRLRRQKRSKLNELTLPQPKDQVKRSVGQERRARQ